MSSFGEELRRERELRQISLREVAEATNINLRFLEALERNDFEHLPGGVYNRGFVRQYSEHIGVDPEAMVNAYLLEEQSQSARGRAQDKRVLRRAPRPARDEAAKESARRRGRGIWVLLALFLVVIAGAIAISVWQWRKSRETSSADGDVRTTRIERRAADSGPAADCRHV